MAQLQRHHLVLDLQTKTGLLTWEALRQTPEGGVYACVANTRAAKALSEQAQKLPELSRPIILNADLANLSQVIKDPELKFDRLIGRNILHSDPDKVATITNLLSWLSDGGAIALAETIRKHTQRLYKLLQPNWIDSQLWHKVKTAEEAIYKNPEDPLVNWDGSSLEQDLATLGLRIQIEEQQHSSSILINSQAIQRWFSPTQADQRPTYRLHLEKFLSPAEVKTLKDVFNKYLCNQTVIWTSVVAYILIAES